MNQGVVHYKENIEPAKQVNYRFMGLCVRLSQIVLFLETHLGENIFTNFFSNPAIREAEKCFFQKETIF